MVKVKNVYNFSKSENDIIFEIEEFYIDMQDNPSTSTPGLHVRIAYSLRLFIYVILASEEVQLCFYEQGQRGRGFEMHGRRRECRPSNVMP